MMNRRGLITGLVSLVVAPAIVRASSLMPTKVIEPERCILRGGKVFPADGWHHYAISTGKLFFDGTVIGPTKETNFFNLLTGRGYFYNVSITEKASAGWICPQFGPDHDWLRGL